MENTSEVSPALLEAMRSQVEKEMDELWQKNPKSQDERSFHEGFDPNLTYDPKLRETSEAYFRKSKIDNYLNNFFFRLPEVDGQMQMGLHRKLVRESDGLNRPSYSNAPNSPLYLNQTPQQFFDAVDLAMQQEVISAEELARLKESINPKNQLKFREDSLKVFIRLRARGYDITELVT